MYCYCSLICCSAPVNAFGWLSRESQHKIYEIVINCILTITSITTITYNLATMYKNSNLLPSYTATDYVAFCGMKLIKTDTVYLLLKFTFDTNEHTISSNFQTLK